MINSWMRFVTTAEDTGGRLAVLEQRITPAGEPPRHVHANEDEAFYVLEGRLAATLGDDTTLSAGPGELMFLPRGIPHSLHVRTDEARLLVMLNPAGFEKFFAAVGEPARGDGPPEPTTPDVEAIAAEAARYGVTLLPPG
ncbi:cupin [Actinomadura sp. NBRC 104412]|nr:cupin [Actinomadura sp. NBRC 104412]